MNTPQPPESPAAPHPFIGSTLASVAEHLDAAKHLIGMLAEQPSVIEDVAAELERARVKVANVRALIHAETEEANRAAARSRDIDHAGAPLGSPVRMNRPTSTGEPREDER